MSSRLDLIDQADALLTRRLAEFDADIDLFAVRILLREALLNGVIHGGQGAEDACVELEVDFGETGIRLRVSDEGDGFDWRSRLARIEVLADGGRGIPLMGIYADELQYDERGKQVTLWKRWARPAGRHMQHN